jgi:Firmicute plasmid replication protein (RepL)
MTDLENPEDLKDDEYGIINMRTGKIQEIKVYADDTGSRWDKVWAKTLAELLDLTGESRTRIIAYLIRNKNYENVILATVRKISEDVGVSTKTVNKTLLQMQNAGFISRLHNGVIMFSPHIIQPGKSWRGVAVMRRWKSEKEQEQ